MALGAGGAEKMERFEKRLPGRGEVLREGCVDSPGN